jgi:LPS-assembly protein
MKIKKILNFIFLSFFIICSKGVSNEIEFEASDMEIKNKGNTIIAFETDATIPSEQVNIKAKKSNYNKKTEIIIFIDDVIFNDNLNNITIKSNKVTYNRKKNIIFSEGKTFINIESDYDVVSKNVYYDRNNSRISSEEKTEIVDKDRNLYQLDEKFLLDINNEIISAKKSIITDKENNKYIFEDLIVNLSTNEIAGKEIKVEFEKSYFGNEDNRPILKGRSGHSDDDSLKVYKGVFSTCNIENKNCRGWELSSDEFNHDKEKKIFEYKNSWLKIFDYKVFFLPYFNHPDPSVKRKSGFLTPSYSSSNRFGTAINFPYYKVIGIDRDLTISPRYYADKSFLLQNEYRQVLLNSNIKSDFSFLVGNEGTKSHLFYNQFGKIKDNVTFKLNLQGVEGDNYLKNHKLSETSSLIEDDGLLLSNLDINWNFENSNLSTSFKVFEDLSQNYHDRYQYIFPEFNFTKNIDIPSDYYGNFNFNSYGYNKNYNTNITETVITNDFLFSSNDFINKSGLSTKYNLLLKNSNDYTDNSTSIDEDINYNLFGTIKVDTSFPLQKRFANYSHYLNPKFSLRYSPNGNSDLSSKDLKLGYNNAFNLNRIENSSEVEGGEALTLGLEFSRIDNNGSNIFDFRVANIIKPQENYKLPAKSKLNKTRSDIFGNINYKFNENLNLGYGYSYDRDLKYSNLDQLNIDFNVNNFYTNFNYFTENHDFGDTENIINRSSYKFNNENKLSFESTKNLKDDFTEYYDLIYTYVTDCISINLNYNKSFYRDGNLEPNKSLSFLVKIIPFTELGVPNVGNLIGK